MVEDTKANPSEPIGLPTYDELEQESLTDVAQQFRFKELTASKWLLFGVGGFSILFYGALLAFAGIMIDAVYAKEVAQNQAEGVQLDPEVVKQLRDADLWSTRAMAATMVTLGLAFCVLGLLVPKYPVMATVSGLILYVCVLVLLMLSGLSAILNGLLIKALIFISLASAIKTALDYERQVKRSRAAKASV